MRIRLLGGGGVRLVYEHSVNHIYVVLVIPKKEYLKPLCEKGPKTEVENGDYGDSVVQGGGRRGRGRKLS